MTEPIISELNENAEPFENINFNIDDYFDNLSKIINKIFQRKENVVFTFDILDTEKTRKNKLIVLQEKQRQMKIGEIWQEALGNYDEFINLKIGHSTGLDIISHTKKVAIELKNRTNTDNASSKKSNLDKLSKFKNANPDYLCIYANINANTEEKTKSGVDKIILHDNQEIRHLVGIPLLNYVFGENSEKIISFIKTEIDKYM